MFLCVCYVYVYVYWSSTILLHQRFHQFTTHIQTHTFSKFALPFHSQKSATRHAFRLAAISHPPAPSHLPVQNPINALPCRSAAIFHKTKESNKEIILLLHHSFYIAFYYTLFTYSIFCLPQFTILNNFIHFFVNI